ncbi:DNA replication and repair protein RecF [Lachnospiraceae bacterium]|nr:DNA replication and repair protein RecF [Lachnospiraceae bacterium]
MIIKKLVLYNFGVYADINTFSFEGKKPIVLIGGMNGRGKTTFLEAVLLALYGANSHAYYESGKSTYGQYLRSFVNLDSNDKRCSVELEFEINNGIKERYTIKREWDAVAKRTKEQIRVLKDGVYNEFLTDNWPMVIENILPCALSNFFFFDGEKIAELAVDNTNAQLKNSIRSMLGISVLDVLGNDIVRNLRRVDKKGENNKSAEELEKLKEEKDHAIEDLTDIDRQIEELDRKIKEENNALEKLRQLYTEKGGDAVGKRQEIVQQRATFMAELTEKCSKLYDLCAAELPLFLVKDLIADIKLQATDEHADLIMKQAISQLDSLYLDFAKGYKGDPGGGAAFVYYVKEQVSSEKAAPIYGLSDQALFQINNLVEGTMKNVTDDAKEILTLKAKLEKQIAELDSYITLDINDSILQQIHKQVEKTEQAILDDQVKRDELVQQRGAANYKVMISTSTFSNYVESYLSTAELRDRIDRISKYSHMALKVLEEFEIELQKRKTDILSETITSCYRKLSNKSNLIQKIVMDSQTLDLQYLSEDGRVVSKESLSAGEKQLMVIAILWALAICSKKKLPVIIDTPLSRLDVYHRMALIKTYFPNAGEQTIILSTDSEIDAACYQLMKENIGEEYTLRYDDETKSTTIVKGYLVGEKT